MGFFCFVLFFGDLNTLLSYLQALSVKVYLFLGLLWVTVYILIIKKMYKYIVLHVSLLSFTM